MSGISNSTYKALDLDYDELNTQYIGVKTEADYWLALTDSQRDTVKELINIDSSISDLQSEKSDVEADIKDLQDSIEDLKADKKKLESDIIQISGKSKKYPAGYLTAGKDFEIGRYKIYGGSSNFVVYSSSGALMVNIILGNDSYSVSEYIYEFSYGDKVEASSAFKMVPVE